MTKSITKSKAIDPELRFPIDLARRHSINIYASHEQQYHRSFTLTPVQEETPRKPPPKKASAKLKKKDLNIHVLVVDDNSTNQLVLSRTLALLGARVSIAHDGQDAISQLRAVNPVCRFSCCRPTEKKYSGTRPPTYKRHNSVVFPLHNIIEPSISEQFDLVLMDKDMPVMNGIEAITRIRELEKAGRLPYQGKSKLDCLPIIGHTADYSDDAIDQFTAAGADDVMKKPFKSANLEQRVRMALNLEL
ncbi:CheY-like protein [Microthyrium microscopicum]|uniref:CheY-like protein n=1 Tax=Microthyrium microscopicum TaxID=703497 RepID=A0A6A6UH23_9PEZI|nr:CheY-like protein [Microthyrium microscopicum]